VAKLLESVLNQVLEVQATEQLRAEPYERTENRQGYRNGSYPHQLTTRAPDSRWEVLDRVVCPLPSHVGCPGYGYSTVAPKPDDYIL